MTKLHIAGLYKSHLLSRMVNMGVEFLQGRPENITPLGMEKIIKSTPPFVIASGFPTCQGPFRDSKTSHINVI